MLEELDCLQVLVSAVFVGDPLAVLATVIQIQHGCNSIDAKSVDMVILYPVQGIGQKEVFDLRTAIVEDLGAPVGMLALPRIGMLVDRVSVKLDQALGILREVRRHPVQDNADLVLVQVVDHVLEILRRSIAGGRCIVARDLIAPGSIQRMLGNADQLDMGISHVLDVLGDAFSKLTVVVEALRILLTVGMLHPGARVHLIDGKGGLVGREFLPVLHPGGIVPFVADIRDAGGRARTLLCPEAIGICLVQPSAILCDDQIFVQLSHVCSGDEGLIDADLRDLHHIVGGLIPAVEFADNIYGGSVRCPYGKPGTFHAIDPGRMCAHLLIDVIVGRMIKKILIQIGKDMGILPGILVCLCFRSRLYLFRGRCCILHLSGSLGHHLRGALADDLCCLQHTLLGLLCGGCERLDRHSLAGGLFFLFCHIYLLS